MMMTTATLADTTFFCCEEEIEYCRMLLTFLRKAKDVNLKDSVNL